MDTIPLHNLCTVYCSICGVMWWAVMFCYAFTFTLLFYSFVRRAFQQNPFYKADTFNAPKWIFSQIALDYGADVVLHRSGINLICVAFLNTRDFVFLLCSVAHLNAINIRNRHTNKRIHKKHTRTTKCSFSY